VQKLLHWREAAEGKPPIDLPYGTAVIGDPAKERKAFCVQLEGLKSHRQLTSSENAWTAQQRAWQVKNTADDKGFASDTQVAREVKSILNKLTIEKFDKLYTKLTECRISTPADVQILVSEIFEKATSQHHFINMYADLCLRLSEFFSERLMPDKPQNGFTLVLLRQCQVAFEKNLVPPAPDPELDREEQILADVRYKTRMLGNIRLVGALVSRRMLSTKALYAILEVLLGDPTPRALKAASVLLTTTGPALDVEDSPCREAFNIFFARIRLLIEKGSCEARIQCLLKDALDLRASGWRTRRPLRWEAPSALHRTGRTKFKRSVRSNSQQDEVVSQAPGPEHVNDLQQMKNRKCLNFQGHKKLSTVDDCEPEVWQPGRKNTLNYVHMISSNMESDRIVKSKVPATAIAKAPSLNQTHSVRGGDCKAVFQKALAEARYSNDVSEVSNCLLNTVVPSVGAQPQLLHDLLVRVCEEGETFLRKAGFEAVFAIYTRNHWKPHSLREGITLFLRGMPDLICDVPNLVQIVREELHPTMKPLVTKGMLPAAAYNALATKL